MNILLKTMDSAVKYLFTVNVDANAPKPIQLTRTSYNYNRLGGVFKGGKAQGGVLKTIGYTLASVAEFAFESIDTTSGYKSSGGGFGEDELSAKQKHDMDSNGLSRSEAIRNPHW